MGATSAGPDGPGTASQVSPPGSASPVAAVEYARQAEKLSHLAQDAASLAVEAEWITPHDPVIVTAGGGRLPEVPLAEARKLNRLRDGIVEGENEEGEGEDGIQEARSDVDGNSVNRNASRRGREKSSRGHRDSVQRTAEGSLRRAMPPSRTNPLFPPLPLYGPPTLLRNIECFMFQVVSFVLSLTFLGVIVLGAAFTSLPLMLRHIWLRLTFRNPDARRPFIGEELRRKKLRKEAEQSWKARKLRRLSELKMEDGEAGENDGFVPTEGGPDPIICDVSYYARRVGLDMEEFKVQTEDGFIIRLWHIYNPAESSPMSDSEREARGAHVFTGDGPSRPLQTDKGSKPKFPILMIHGLLQSSGAYCTNDDASLAFYLCKQGYDVWLGNNRCGFRPEHTLLSPNDPRMWAWNIRQMGVIDLPALISRVLAETGFAKLGLIAHSQGTTETLVALAKEQRPDLGLKMTVFCALAPAAYAGPLIRKVHFRFMRVISPALFRLVFGIHAFIPFMMAMHRLLPGTLYGAMGYRVFAFLFGWTDDRWERGLRDRMFQFAPVYVSAESMRWWLGRECFARHKCILATKEEGRREEELDGLGGGTGAEAGVGRRETHSRGSTAWYDERCPPLALWVAGSDELVDGRRLLRRFERGREPHVRIVHEKVIEEYEHLDVIWAVDMIEQVGREVKEVLWKTCDVRDKVIVPKGCENVEAWTGVEIQQQREEAGEGEEEESNSSGDEAEENGH